ncbi:hypothetical protein LguiA_017355 [Lonicera macranthoides]
MGCTQSKIENESQISSSHHLISSQFIPKLSLNILIHFFSISITTHTHTYIYLDESQIRPILDDGGAAPAANGE